MCKEHPSVLIIPGAQDTDLCHFWSLVGFVKKADTAQNLFTKVQQNWDQNAQDVDC